jgi:imidazole glycerol-phosphate synthase subunit HisF
MNTIRLIARLDVKMSWLIKGVQMDGWRKVGRPAERAQDYYALGIDEILLMDVVASLYQRNSLHDIVSETASQVFVPMTVGGGVASIDDARALLVLGADKIAINTAATARPALINEISTYFGAQATVVSIEAIRHSDGSYEAMTDNGRNPAGIDVLEWAVRAEQEGAGELLVTCVNVEGTGKGPDLNLIEQICKRVNIPVIASGGVGNVGHVVAAAEVGASAIAIAQSLHYHRINLVECRDALRSAGFRVRTLPIDADQSREQFVQ